MTFYLLLRPGILHILLPVFSHCALQQSSVSLLTFFQNPFALVCVWQTPVKARYSMYPHWLHCIRMHCWSRSLGLPQTWDCSDTRAALTLTPPPLATAPPHKPWFRPWRMCPGQKSALWGHTGATQTTEQTSSCSNTLQKPQMDVWVFLSAG